MPLMTPVEKAGLIQRAMDGFLAERAQKLGPDARSTGFIGAEIDTLEEDRRSPLVHLNALWRPRCGKQQDNPLLPAFLVR